MNIYEKLGVRTIINASATETCVGGSVKNLKMVAAMEEASQYFVDLNKLQIAVGERLAKITNNEAAMVTTGAAGGLFLAVAGCLKLADPAVFSRLPDEIPRSYRVLAYRSHFVEYVTGIKQVGVNLVGLGSVRERDRLDAWELEEALNDDGALAVVYVMAGLWIPPGAPSLEEVAKVCRARNVPLIVDAAAQLPPVENLWRITQAGATVAIFSGGKDLRGPSSTGLMVGKKDLIKACSEIITPNRGIGRILKVDKEEMVGLLTAVEEYLAMDHTARLEWSEEQVKKAVEGLKGIEIIKVERAFPNEAGQPIPRVKVSFDRNAAGLDRTELLQKFSDGEPAIRLAPGPGESFYINPMTLKTGEMELIIQRIKEFFTALPSRRRG